MEQEGPWAYWPWTPEGACLYITQMSHYWWEKYQDAV